MIPVMALMALVGIAQAFVTLALFVLIFCLYLSFAQSLRLVVPDD